MSATLIAIDAGTTGVSCVLFDDRLRQIARAYREFSQHFPAPGWVEHDAAQILAAVDATLAEIALEPRARDAVALGITNQRETVFALDRASGRAIERGIVWQDRRTAQRCEELAAAGLGALVEARSGLRLDPYFSATKIEWMLRNRAGLAERAARGEIVFATVDTLVLSHLCADREFRTEPTNASRTALFDIEARRWDPQLCGCFGIDPAWLPDVRSSVGPFGRVRCDRTFAGLPVLGIAGDQQAALLGHGGTAVGALKITYGTGCFLLLNTGPVRRRAPSGFLGTLAIGARGEVCHALEGSVFMGGAVIQFLRDQLGLLERSSDSEALARSVPDTAGVVLVPAFAGLGAPYWDPNARGALLGLTRGTTRAHVVRAGLEAIAFQNAELLELLVREAGADLREVRVDGGAVENDLLLELQADLCGLEIVRAPISAATARGAAILAAWGSGAWSFDAPPAIEGAAQRFVPRIDAPERAARLAAWRAAVARVR